MDQLYRLGTKMRSKYIEELGFLPRNYSGGHTIYVRSTDKDRTLMSAESFLYGLYPLGTGPAGSNFIKNGESSRPMVFRDIVATLLAVSELPLSKISGNLLRENLGK